MEIIEKRINQLIKVFSLHNHPEGGFYKEVYRSDELIPSNGLPQRFTGPRNFGTSIYYLLSGTQVSSFHKINQDETWHHYEGGTLEVHVIGLDGKYRIQKLGKNIEQGEVPQFTVFAEEIFGAKLHSPNNYAFTGCTVAPGFDFEDFKLLDAESLIFRFPQLRDQINSFNNIT